MHGIELGVMVLLGLVVLFWWCGRWCSQILTSEELARAHRCRRRAAGRRIATVAGARCAPARLISRAATAHA